MALYTPTAVAMPAQTNVPADGEAPTGAILGGPHEIEMNAIKRLQDGELLTTEPAEGVLRWRRAGGLLGGLRRRHWIMVDDVDTTLDWDSNALECDVLHYPGDQDTASARTLTLPHPGSYSGGALALQSREWRVCRHAKEVSLEGWRNLTIRFDSDGAGTMVTIADFGDVSDTTEVWAGHVDLMVTSGAWRVIGVGGSARQKVGPTVETPIPIEAQP